jgi:hypothetical protein
LNFICKVAHNFFKYARPIGGKTGAVDAEISMIIGILIKETFIAFSLSSKKMRNRSWLKYKTSLNIILK